MKKFFTDGLVQIIATTELLNIRINPHYSRAVVLSDHKVLTIFTSTTDEEKLSLPSETQFPVENNEDLKRTLFEAATTSVLTRVFLQGTENKLTVVSAILPAPYDPKNDTSWGWGLGYIDSRTGRDPITGEIVDIIHDAY